MKRIIIIILIAVFAFSIDAEAQSFGKKRTRTSATKKFSAPRKKVKAETPSVSTPKATKTVKEAKSAKPAKKAGVLTRVKNAAASGYGNQLGREAARGTVKGVKNLYKKGKEKYQENKEK